MNLIINEVNRYFVYDMFLSCTILYFCILKKKKFICKQKMRKSSNVFKRQNSFEFGDF